MKDLFVYFNESAKKSADVDLKDVKGKEAKEWSKDGATWGVDEPTDNDAATPINKDELNKNMKRLLLKFKTNEDFFIVGEAGWGKTSIIKDLAKKFNRSVITVYLDKAVASDLGGIPVPVKGKTGAVQEMAMPAWAKIMQDNPDKKFLLFFDEMNQAAPDVMNALMPIVLEHEICGVKFDNFFVGAAGNFEHENNAVNELNGPLRSRFKPIIVWETGGEAWKGAFKFLHKQWDDKLSESLVDMFEKNAEIFENPREIDHKIFKFIYKLKEAGDYDYFDVEDYKDRLDGLVKEDLTRKQEDAVNSLAEALYNYMNNVEKEETGRSRKSSKDAEMVPEVVKNAIKLGMKNGFLVQGGVKYGISRENIGDIVDDNDCNAEMLERVIRKLEADGIKFKYEKNSEWEKAGYKNPAED